MKKHIQEFIDFNYKEASFLDYFIGFFVLGFFTFLIVPTNTEKPAVTYFALFIGAMLGGGNYLLKIYLLRWDEKKITNKFIDYLNDADE